MPFGDRSKVSFVVPSLVLLCLYWGQALGVPIYYNHPRLLDYVDGEYVTIRPGSIEKLSPNGTRSILVSDLDEPSGIALDTAGNLYYGNVSSGSLITSLFKRTPDGTVIDLGHVVDTSGYRVRIGGWGFDVAISPTGDIYYNHPRLLDYVNGEYVTVRPGSVEKLTPDGARSTVVSGLDEPSGIGLDAAGNLYYGNTSSSSLSISLFKRTPDGTVTNLGQVVDTSGYSVRVGAWGFDVAVGSAGEIYYNHPSLLDYVGGKYITVEKGFIGELGPDGARSTVVSGLNEPSGIALDPAGNLYYGDVISGSQGISLFRRTPDGTITNLGQVVDASEYSVRIGGWGFDVAIPEPATVFLLGLGGLAFLRRRKR